MGKSISLTVVTNMTSNYGEGLGNVSSVQKIFRDGKMYAVRTRESLKNALMVQSKMYEDLKVTVDSATQKEVSEELNAANCRALEGGYMNTVGANTYIRNSSFYLTDAIACDEFVNETRFHNNLYMAQTYAKDNGLNLQNKGDSKKCGLMPYQYEYDKSLKIYSITIDLDEIGKDKNFDSEAKSEEKVERVICILDAIKMLSMVVKGNLDNAEPIFVVGGLINYKTHYFENVVHVKNNKLIMSDDLIAKKSDGCNAGLLTGSCLENDNEIKDKLQPISIHEFFKELENQVKKYYEV